MLRGGIVCESSVFLHIFSGFGKFESAKKMTNLKISILPKPIVKVLKGIKYILKVRKEKKILVNGKNL